MYSQIICPVKEQEGAQTKVLDFYSDCHLVACSSNATTEDTGTAIYDLAVTVTWLQSSENVLSIKSSSHHYGWRFNISLISSIMTLLINIIWLHFVEDPVKASTFKGKGIFGFSEAVHQW